jgi:hypothetical protein
MPFKLGDFQQLPKVEGQTFDNKTVTIDGTYYRNCTFNKCKLIYCGGPARLDACSISPGCAFEFHDSAAFLLQMLGELGWTLVPPAWMGPSKTSPA